MTDNVYDLLDKYYQLKERVDKNERDIVDIQSAFNDLVRQLSAPRQPQQAQDTK